MFRKAVGKIWKLLPHSARMWIVRRTQQKFTISAAAIIVNERREILLLDHVLRPRSGWGLPGGFLGRGEEADDAVRREVREETELEMENLRLFRLRTIDRHIEILFLASPVGKAKVRSREIYELGWFCLDKLPEKLSHGQKAIIEKVLKSES